MRISDWSSDVCSSDLFSIALLLLPAFVLALGARQFYAQISQLIGLLVTRVAGMPAHPFPGQGMRLDLSVQLLPQVGVLDRLLVSRAPIAALPVGQPLVHAFLHILRIGMNHHIATALRSEEHT